MLVKENLDNLSAASRKVALLSAEIMSYQKSLDDTQDLVIFVYVEGSEIPMLPAAVDILDSETVIFCGTVNGAPAKLVVPADKLTVLISNQTKPEFRPAHRIGY